MMLCTAGPQGCTQPGRYAKQKRDDYAHMAAYSHIWRQGATDACMWSHIATRRPINHLWLHARAVAEGLKMPQPRYNCLHTRPFCVIAEK